MPFAYIDTLSGIALPVAEHELPRWQSYVWYYHDTLISPLRSLLLVAELVSLLQHLRNGAPLMHLASRFFRSESSSPL